jgi:hypothetical protein
MTFIGLEESDQLAFFTALAAILHLGNLEFSVDKDEHPHILPQQATKACQLLSVSPESLNRAICMREVNVAKGETIVTSQSMDQALAALQSLCKTLYSKVSAQWGGGEGGERNPWRDMQIERRIHRKVACKEHKSDREGPTEGSMREKERNQRNRVAERYRKTKRSDRERERDLKYRHKRIGERRAIDRQREIRREGGRGSESERETARARGRETPTDRETDRRQREQKDTNTHRETEAAAEAEGAKHSERDTHAYAPTCHLKRD